MHKKYLFGVNELLSFPRREDQKLTIIIAGIVEVPVSHCSCSDAGSMHFTHVAQSFPSYFTVTVPGSNSMFFVWISRTLINFDVFFLHQTAIMIAAKVFFWFFFRMIGTNQRPAYVIKICPGILSALEFGEASHIYCRSAFVAGNTIMIIIYNISNIWYTR